MSKGRHTRRTTRRRWVVPLIVVAVLAVAGSGTAYAAYRYDRSAASRIMPGVTIGGVDVGGMTRDEAVRAVWLKAGVRLSAGLEVRAAGESWYVTPSRLGMHADVEGAVGRAFAIADSMSMLSRVYHRLADKPVGSEIPLGYAEDQVAVTAFVQQAYEAVDESPIDAAIRLVKNQLVVRHAKPGQAIEADLAAKRILGALKRQAVTVDIPVEPVEPSVTAASLGRTIVVDLSDNTLTLYGGLKIEKEFPVATAMPGYTTPVGTWKVVNKVENPTWYNPAPTTWGAGEPLVIPPGPGNPLGTRALYLSAPDIRIHGTYASSSIGTHASHGCIRMYISDSEELYPLVPIGTKVIIKP